jgi:hypothetical protein
MMSLRSAAAGAASLLLLVLATIALWPRDPEPTRAAGAQDDSAATMRGAGEEPGAGDVVSAEHREVAEPNAPEPDAPADNDPARNVMLRGRVLDGRGHPVAGASVRLEARGVRGRALPVLRTAADGGFACPAQVRGERSVNFSVSHPEYAPAQVQRPLPRQDAGDVTVADITLGRGGTVRGQVTRAHGAPTFPAQVQLTAQTDLRAPWQDAKGHEVDTGGAFVFTRVPPGTYRLVARAPRMVAASSDFFAVSEAGEVVVPPLALADGVLLTGTVSDRRGRGIPRAVVGVLAAGGVGPTSRAVTDAEGRFRLDHLPAQRRDVRVSAAGYVVHTMQLDLATQEHLAVTLEDGLRLFGVVRDARTGAPVEAFAELVVRLRNLPQPMPAEHAGRSLHELQQLLNELLRTPAAGAAEERAGRVARLRAAIDHLGMKADNSANRSEASVPQALGASTPHPGGEFTYQGLDAGVYVVDVSADGYYAVRSAPVELRPGQPPPSLTITLTPGVAVQGRVVRAGTEQGVAQARIELMLAQAPVTDPQRVRGPVLANTVSGADGAFTLRNVRPGHGVLRVVAKGFDTAVSAPLSVQADVGGVRIELRARASLTGKVRGVPAGREGEVTVVALATARNNTDRGVNADGSYRLDDLQPNSYHVRAYLSDTGTAVRQLRRELSQVPAPAPSIALAAGEERSLDLDLVVIPTSQVRGVALVNGAPASGHAVQLVERDQRHEQTYNMNAEAGGTFTFAAVEPGSYDLVLFNLGRDRVPLHKQPVDVLAGEDRTVTVQASAATFAVTLIAPETGASLSGTIQLRPRGAAPERQSERGESNAITLRVDAEGRSMVTVPAGPFTIDVTAAERDVARVDVEFAAGEHRDLRLHAGARRDGPPPRYPNSGK